MISVIGSKAEPLRLLHQSHGGPSYPLDYLKGTIIREPPVSAPIAGIRPSLKSSQNSETFSVEKCMKSEVDPGKLVTSRNSDGVGQLFSFRYL